MAWWIWFLLILVLLSLIVLIVLLLRWSRRKEVASETMQVMEPPAEPVAMTVVEPEEAAEEVVTEVEDTAIEMVVETEETVAKVEDTATEVATEAKKAVAEVEPVVEEAAKEIVEPVVSRAQQVVPVEPPPPDDLKIIEGIGPKISSVLQAAGITTLAQLAVTDVERLKDILKEANIRLGYPDTWPEQAGLAAEGKWDKLTALQDSLKGGRRV